MNRKISDDINVFLDEDENENDSTIQRKIYEKEHQMLESRALNVNNVYGLLLRFII